MRPYTHSLDATPGTEAPDNALRVALPKAKPGFHFAEKNGKWVYIESHKDEKGYVNGEPYTIKDYGPYPEGWSKEQPETTIAEARERKWLEIILGQAEVMSKIKEAYPNDEREGWPFKLPEAEAILAGSTEPMPYIDAEFAGSQGLYADRAELARKVMQNNAGFKSISGFINGQQTSMYHRLERLCAQEGVSAADILAMPVEYTLPEGL